MDGSGIIRSMKKAFALLVIAGFSCKPLNTDEECRQKLAQCYGAITSECIRRQYCYEDEAWMCDRSFDTCLEDKYSHYCSSRYEECLPYWNDEACAYYYNECMTQYKEEDSIWEGFEENE